MNPPTHEWLVYGIAPNGEFMAGLADSADGTAEGLFFEPGGLLDLGISAGPLSELVSVTPATGRIDPPWVAGTFDLFPFRPSQVTFGLP